MTIKNQTELDDIIEKAIEALKNRDVELATTFLHEAMIYDEKLACVHNLFGIIAEIKGDVDLACSYYRASNVFDSQYEPANSNLERITNFEYHFNLSKICFSDKKDNLNANSETNDYFIDYDHNGIGHIKKKG